MTQTRYGIISDIHGDPRVIIPAVGVMEQLGVDKYILNGDLADRKSTLLQSQDALAIVLVNVARTGKEVIAYPGSHETLGMFNPVIDACITKFSNLNNGLEEQVLEAQDHTAVFLPGSDFLCGGEYKLTRNNLPTGIYNPNRGLIYHSNMNDLRKLVIDGEKTILFCHIPRKFNFPGEGVDTAYFAEKEDRSIIPGVVFDAQVEQQYGKISEDDKKLIAAKNGLTLKREHRGNIELRDILLELKVTKAVNGHFHESSHKAHDKFGRFVPQGEFVSELYWNSGDLSLGYCGILTVQDGKVSYQNINLRDYLQ